MKTFYVILALVAAAGTAVIVMQSSGGNNIVTLPPDLVPGQAAGYVMGSADARVEITEFGDFECPGCGEFANVTEPDVRERLVKTGLARFRFVDFPLEGHQHAMSAHVAATCADEQGKFWEIHDRLFAGQAEWSPITTKNPKRVFDDYARNAGLDFEKWNTCYEERRPLPRILANKQEGVRIGVGGTPTIIIGNLKVPNANFDKIKRIVDSLNAIDTTGADAAKGSSGKQG
jgi:protein-disulfide isomerase